MSAVLQEKNGMQRTSTFCVVYDGPDHKNHEIDIITFGHALTSLGKVLHEANYLLNGDRTSLKVEVNADFIEGSFGFEVILTQLLANSTDILNVLGFSGAVGAGTGTVVGALKALKGRDITAIDVPINDEDEVKILVQGAEVKAPQDVARLITNKTFRSAIEGLISTPLKNAGTTSFSIMPEPNSTPVIKIKKVEESSFADLAVESKEEESTYETTIKFIAADIKKVNGWRVEIGETIKTVRMEDDLFRQRLLNMEEPHIFGQTFAVRIKKHKTSRLRRTTTTLSIVRVHHEQKMGVSKT